VAKGGRLFDATLALETAVDQSRARDIALSSTSLAELLTSKDYGFLYANPLTTLQKREWRAHGCEKDECVQVTFYDYDDGGSIEATLNLTTGQLLDQWRDFSAKPGASPFIVPRALSIANDDPRVQDLIGNIRESEPLMVPMSAWLADDQCQENWCVDLTFMAPDGSGRILHVMVDMDEDRVDRLFYTRGRPERAYKQPAAQGPRFNNDCHEQYGWKVCWQMTANDGVEFYDATYQENLIFSSAKIGQVEVYYPSWPGGYRDEVGYSASVHPYYGTNVEDLGDYFEVRQLFTEFLRWPNCICCYRYEQIMRFYVDGTFELDFVSHGPGCDDLSSYRPFWRIDLDIGDSINDETWYWNGAEWALAKSEIKLPLFDTQSPKGFVLFTGAADTGYLWAPTKTDPQEQDEGWMFVLRQNQGEGDGQIATGPAETFWPPGQWQNDEQLSRENIVLWYIPILNTKHGDPWWCMPDPEPDFSPCNASLRVEPASKRPESPVSTLTTDPTPDQTPVPSPTRTSVSTATPRPVAGEDVGTIILNSGCGSCHVIGDLGEAGKVGPDLSDIGTTASDRVEGLTATEYLRQSILEPNVFIAPDCPNGPCLKNIMPSDYAERLSSQQVTLLVEFLLNQTGDPSPTAKDDTTQGAPLTRKTTGDEEIVQDSEATPEPIFAKDTTRGWASSVVVVLLLVISIFLLLMIITRRADSNSDSD
jgi:hypothetical protein